MAVKRAVVARIFARTPLIDSQVRVSKSNAHNQRAVRKWREQFRKLKLEFESKTGPQLEPSHPLVPWPVTLSRRGHAHV